MFRGFLLGAIAGGVVGVCIFALCVGVCTAIRPNWGPDDVDPVADRITVVAFVMVILCPLIGGIVGLSRAIRSEKRSQPDAGSVTKPN